mmetsp:Transcript_39995/g.119119  ORF Transcript_39995/g.119119 Transcript_39995/m.119119 type:complete len:239 (-) Transcript_39995:879-1595(-)
MLMCKACTWTTCLPSAPAAWNPCRQGNDARTQPCPKAPQHIYTHARDATLCNVFTKHARGWGRACKPRSRTPHAPVGSSADCNGLRTQHAPHYTLVTLYILIVQSIDADARYFPSGDAATAVTSSLCVSMVLKHSSVEMRHNLTVLSSPPDMIQSPSGVTSRQFTLLLWPVNVKTGVPASTSHSLIVSSHEPDTSRLLVSGIHLTHVTWLLCPPSTLTQSPLSISHTRTVLSAHPVAR